MSLNRAEQTWPADNTHTITLPDGYNGSTCTFFAEPIERDGGLVRLRCADAGKQYMTAWKHVSCLTLDTPGSWQFDADISR